MFWKLSNLQISWISVALIGREKNNVIVTTKRIKLKKQLQLTLVIKRRCRLESFSIQEEQC